MSKYNVNKLISFFKLMRCMAQNINQMQIDHYFNYFNPDYSFMHGHM